MVDYSNLPESIIHQVMSYLTSKDAIRTSILSKTFHSSWCTFLIPIIDFDQYSFFRKQSFSDTETDSFLDFVANFLESSRPRVNLEKLRFKSDLRFFHSFCDRWYDNYKLDSRIMRMINFAIENNVRELELDFGITYERKYNLPSSIFWSKSIKILTLKNIGFLSQNLILRSFPCMEIFNLIDCNCLETVTLDANAQLKAVKIESCSALKKIDIEPAALLEYFSCETGVHSCFKPFDFNISSSTSPNLKHLKLTSNLKDSLIQSNLSEFRYLVTLKLEGSFAFNNILQIHLEYLKTLELNRVDFDRVEINAPSMVSFTIVPSFESAKTPEIDITSSSCTNLKHLKFRGRYVPEIWIKHKFSQFLNLETLELDRYCITFNKLELLLEYHRRSLKRESCEALSEIEIEAPNLVSFAYRSFCAGHHPDIDISISSTNLKHLVFRGDDLPYKWIRNNFSEFPLLETLELVRCTRMKQIKLRLEYLKSLKLDSCVDMSEVEIEAPNLVSFTYSGSCDVSYDKRPVIITSKAKLDVMIHLSFFSGTEKYLINLRNLIEQFAQHCQTLTLHCSTFLENGDELIYSEELRNILVPPVYNLKHLKVKLECLHCKFLEQLVGSLLWLSPHPNIISFIMKSEVKSLKFHYKDEEDVESWRRDLKEVTMENFEDTERTILQNYFTNILK
nr:uncharacterized protein LOC107406269 [Ziziphus jujuba var. spinosa]